MYHMQIRLRGEEDIALVLRQLDFALAELQVRSIRHYTGPRVGSRTWYVIFRGVTPGNWERMRTVSERVLRNHDCTYSLKPPTMRPPTRI